jgi:hypothetical protein
MAYKSPAWSRKAGKNPKGGLNEAGRRSARAQGMNLKKPVRGRPRTLDEMKRKGSYLSRAAGQSGPLKDSKGRPTRRKLALTAWGASSPEDARKKGKYWLERYESAKKSSKGK